MRLGWGDLTVSTADVFTGDCTAGYIHAELELFDTDGTTQLAFHDDIDAPSLDDCSTITLTNLAAGTYYALVSASEQFCQYCTFGYSLPVQWGAEHRVRGRGRRVGQSSGRRSRCGAPRSDRARLRGRGTR